MENKEEKIKEIQNQIYEVLHRQGNTISISEYFECSAELKKLRAERDELRAS